MQVHSQNCTKAQNKLKWLKHNYVNEDNGMRILRVE